MRLPLGSLLRVGRRLRPTVLVVLAAPAGAATVVGFGAGPTQFGTAGTRASVGPPARVLRAGPLTPAASATAAPTVFVAGRRRGARSHSGPRRGGAAHYRRTASRHVPSATEPGYLPLYRAAAAAYGVDWRLLASVHRQETAFSTEPGTYVGLNSFGCCAGPMQFNVTNGPVSTWKLYRQAFRTGERPKRYPHRTSFHPSVYDDFDAIMAAASLLGDSGASGSLDGGAWLAAYGYYGHDLFGVTYANQVLARAIAWERDGFCLNCALDESLVAEQEDTFGAPIREELLAAERRRKHRERDKRHPHKKRRARKRPGGSDAPAVATPPPSSRPPKSDQPKPPAEPPPPAVTTPPPTTRPTTTTPTTTTPPPPPDPGCSPLRKLLGC